MKIPQIDFERERGEPYMLQVEKLFNPILHSCIEDTQVKIVNECRCGSMDEDDYYPNNKTRCKYCVRKRINAKPRRKYATCDCGNKGVKHFYFSKDKILYPCRDCRKTKTHQKL